MQTGSHSLPMSRSRARREVGPLVDTLGNRPTSVLPHEMANEFNNYFASVFSIEDTSNMPSADKIFHGTVSEELHEITVTRGIAPRFSVRANLVSGVYQ